MTTIAVKNGIVAYDSRLTQDCKVLDDNFNKRREKDGVQFFIAGNITDDDAVMSGYFSGIDVNEEVEGSPEADFLIVDGTDIYYGGVCEEVFWKMKLTTTTPYAVGSGSSYAIGAMDAGATAKEAVQIASRDVFTGGKTRSYQINKK